MTKFEEELSSRQIFCGNEQTYLAGLGLILSKVHGALSMISGMQQPPDPTVKGSYEEHLDQCEFEHQFLVRNVQVIVTMLLGPDYVVQKKLSKEAMDLLERLKKEQQDKRGV
jgi:hypothetical protein